MEQFNTFCTKNNPKDLQTAISYFSIFGGLDEKIDTSRPLDELIKTVILDKYKVLHPIITKITQSNSIYHSLLSGIALGDGRVHSAFKRAKINDFDGDRAIDFLLDCGIVKLERSCIHTFKDEDEISDKLKFTVPFFRFWFAFVSPLFKGIAAGDYQEFEDRFKSRSSEFAEFIFEELSRELIKKAIDGVSEVSSGWNKSVQIPIYAKSSSGQIIVGVSKYSNTKMKKSELVKLQDTTKLADIKADIFVLISKEGFSNELKGLKSSNIVLFSLKHFKILSEI